MNIPSNYFHKTIIIVPYILIGQVCSIPGYQNNGKSCWATSRVHLVQQQLGIFRAQLGSNLVSMTVYRK